MCIRDSPPGAKVHEKHNLRIQGRMQIFEKMSQKVLKRVLTLAKSKISKNAADPAKNYGFTKQKHFRGDKTLKI